jgi:hypothetical protein
MTTLIGLTSLFKKNGQTLSTAKEELNKYPPPPAGVNEVRFDDNGNLLVNGKPTFIYGAYLIQYNQSWYDFLERNGFNGFVEWGPYLSGRHSPDSWGLIRTDTGGESDVAAARSNFIKYRMRPNLLGYRLIDEPNSTHKDPNLVRQHYEAAKEEDPYHPAGNVMSLTMYGVWKFPVKDYTDTGDFIGLDAYPLYKEADLRPNRLANVSEDIRYLRDERFGLTNFENIDLPIIAVPQMWGNGIWRMPNNQESKNMIYQFISGGAASFFTYSYNGTYNERWQYYGNNIIPELKRIEPAIFAPFISGSTVPDENSFRDILITSSDDKVLEWSYRRTSEKEYIFLINTSSYWNHGSRGIEAPKNKSVTVNLTFNLPGSDIVEVLVADNAPKEYKLRNNQLTLRLDGVDSAHTGVMVLSRDLGTRTLKSPADFDCSRRVDIVDLIILLQNWGTDGSGYVPPQGCSADLDLAKDGKINILDLVALLKEWGAN